MSTIQAGARAPAFFLPSRDSRGDEGLLSPRRTATLREVKRSHVVTPSLRASLALGFTLTLPLPLPLACEPTPPDEPPPEPPPPLASPYQVTPEICDAGRVAVDDVGTCTLTVTNVTDVDVNVTGATSGPPFIAVGAAGTLSPGESLVVTVNALPRAEGVVEGELALGPGRLVVPLVVEGIGNVITELNFVVTPEDVVVGDTVLVDSSFPADDLTFEWTLLSRPAESATALATTTEPAVSFVADAAGAYQLGFELTRSDGTTASATVGVSARAPRDLALTTTGGLLHFRPDGEALCGPLDCFAGDCALALGNGPRQSPTSVGGGILVGDLPVGTFRAAVTLAEGEAAVSPTVSAFVQGASAGEATFAIEPGDAHEAFDILVSADGLVTIVDVSETIVGGACSSR